MLGKIFLFATAGIVSTAIVVPSFRRKLDRNILRPIRDYNEHLSHWNDFRTEVLNIVNQL